MKQLMILMAFALMASPLAAQDPALVEALAPVLQSEDRRVLDFSALSLALEYPDPMVRKYAVRAVGRIGKRDGIDLIQARLYDQDDAVVQQTFFALGLIGDSSAVNMIDGRLRSPETLSSSASAEAAIALARIGGSEAAEILSDVIRRVGSMPSERREAMLADAVLESWRLSREQAAIVDLRRITRDTSSILRWRSVVALSRLKAYSAVDELLTAAKDRIPLVREAAVRGLTSVMADSSGAGRAPLLEVLKQALHDETSGVKINALNSIAGFSDSSVSDEIRVLLRDNNRNVRVAAADALGRTGGSGAITALSELFDDGGKEWALHRASLLGLAHLNSSEMIPRAELWLDSHDKRSVLAALEALGTNHNVDPALFRAAIRSDDPEIRRATFFAWANSDSASESLHVLAESALRDSDSRVQSAALIILSDTASDEALDRLATVWRTGDPEVQSAVAIVLRRFMREDPSLMSRLATSSRRPLLRRPDDPRVRLAMTQNLPTIAARWGGLGAVETGKTLQDYRELVAHFLLVPSNPRVIIDVERRGKIEIELLPRDAPLTVVNFLKIMDRGWFSGISWHRVVPNFVVQTGDLGSVAGGGPDWTIRDESNQLRYDQPMVGMALSGPDTGNSQWFINLSPQPHLNGTYTIFGKVVGSYGPLKQIQQGDVIRSIKRLGPS